MFRDVMDVKIVDAQVVGQLVSKLPQLLYKIEGMYSVSTLD